MPGTSNQRAIPAKLRSCQGLSLSCFFSSVTKQGYLKDKNLTLWGAYLLW